jgi:nicotinamide riboside transporter PnuC
MILPTKLGQNYKDSIASLVFTPIVLVLVLVRLYVRTYLTRRPGWDDLTCVLAVVSQCRS